MSCARPDLWEARGGNDPGPPDVRQVSQERENDDLTLKPLLESCGQPTPPGQGWSPAGSESCVVTGRPLLRSVDSERVGRVIEPRDK